MKLINKTLLVLSVSGWTVFFCEINNITQYWAGVALFLGLIGLTGLYILTKPSSIKVLQDDESDKEARKQQARTDMQNMDELYNQLLINEIINSK